MWYDRTDREALTDEALLERLKEYDHQIILLEGPTGCGKTRLLRKLEQEDARQMLILSEERFVRSLLAECGAKEGEWPFHKLTERFGIVCIEEADMMCGKTATQESAAYYLGKAAENALMIITGIRLCERITVLIEQLNVPARLIEYRTDQE